MLRAFVGGTKDGDKKKDENAIVGETDGMIAGCRSIAINVLGFVGYGSQRSWRQESTEPPIGFRMSYMDSILAVVENLIPAAMVPVKILTSPVMPKSIQSVGYAVTEFPEHVKDLLETERLSKRPPKDNLMSTLVKVSDAQNVDMNSKTKLFLSEKELAGNLFQFTIAGFDTTANTMAYAITLLAIYPEWQKWIHEELDQKLSSDEDLKYDAVYPGLKRCLALMVG